MKDRITLTIEPRVSMRAKIFAQKHGTSVSALVEKLLIEVTSSSVSGRASIKTPFSARWAGKFSLSEKTDTRTRKLNKKYGLESGQ